MVDYERGLGGQTWHDKVKALPIDEWRTVTDYQMERLMSHAESERGSRERRSLDVKGRFDTIETKVDERVTDIEEKVDVRFRNIEKLLYTGMGAMSVLQALILALLAYSNKAG